MEEIESIASQTNEKIEFNIKSCQNFISVVQFVNIFKSTLCLDSIASIELENSLKYPDIDPLCLNILLKLIMKKALFKPTSKIGENFEYNKLQEMLIKKIDYFYKLYLRQLKKQYPEITNLNDLIELDINESNIYNSSKFNLSAENLENKVLWDLDLQVLMILDFFRKFKGRNPLVKYNKINKNNDIDLLTIENNNEIDDERKVDEANDESGKDQNEFYYTFKELSVSDKVEILYFFCNFALSFSGRSNLYKEEITKSIKEVKESKGGENKENKDNTKDTNLNNTNNIVNIATSTNVVNLNSSNYADIKKNKRPTILGYDSEGYTYFSIFCNQDCRIYKEKKNKDLKLEFCLVLQSYDEVEKLMAKFENSRSSQDQNLIKKLKENLLKYKEFDEGEKLKELHFLKKMQHQEKILKIANNKDEKKNTTADYYALINVMNETKRVVTRHQLNQISKVASSQINMMTGRNNSSKVVKPVELTEDQKRHNKAEKDRLEREKRMEKRKQKIEQSSLKEDFKSQFPNEKIKNDALGKKRNRMRKRKSKYSDDELGESAEDYSSEGKSGKSDDMELYSDNPRDDQENSRRGGDQPRNQYKNNNRNNRIQISNSETVNLVNDDNNELNENYEVSGSGEVEGNLNDIILEGNLIYRYTNDQVELDGFWFMSQDFIKERLSYLFMHGHEFLECDLDQDEIIEQLPCSNNFQTCANKIKICSANIFECVLINKSKVFESVLQYLSGEYGGYFMYYGKTIEDKVNLNLTLQDSLVKINGEGTNNLGNYKVIGYMNFFKTKEELLQKNDIESEIIKLAEFRLTKIYTAFNPNENYRVIKSFQHRRKKIDEDLY